jgi:hypothetical protein
VRRSLHALEDRDRERGEDIGEPHRPSPLDAIQPDPLPIRERQRRIAPTVRRPQGNDRNDLITA